MKRIAVLSTSLALSLISLPSFAGQTAHTESTSVNNSVLVAAKGRIEVAFSPKEGSDALKERIGVAFSPKEGSEALVIKAIDSATQSLDMLEYSFTSAPITAALLKAKHRGVHVRLVVDHKSNFSEDQSGKARSALNALSLSGCMVRAVSVFAVKHDEVIIIDHRTVELGRFNYSAAAANADSENVMVVWDNADLAAVHSAYFERNFALSQSIDR
jgi:phosphatidylserine/phosphatidylglycerophosphate/cardiolipin synthase-like enzyme